MTRWLVAIAACALGACVPTEDDVVQWNEDFEACGLCNWDGGPASVVVTNHPGEHAAQLESGAVISHALAISAMQPDDYYNNGSFTDGNWIEYSTDCVGRPAFEVVATTPPDLDLRLTLEGPGGTAFERRHLTFPRDPYGGAFDTVTYRHLYIGTAGRCRLDNVRIMVSGGTIGY